MVIKSDDAEYLALFMISPVEAKAASTVHERSVREDTMKDSRDVESQQETDSVDTRSVLDDLDQFVSSMSGKEKIQSMDDALSCSDELNKRKGCLVAANSYPIFNKDAAALPLPKKEKLKKTKGLLHRVLPTLSKADVANNRGSGSLITALTSKESYTTDGNQSKSGGRLDRNFPSSSVSECPSQNKIFFGRPPQSRRTEQSQHGLFVAENFRYVTKNEKILNGDDGSISVSIIAAASDCEFEIEKGDERQIRKQKKSASLADCVAENSSVVTEKRSIFGGNRSKKEKHRQENIYARSVAGSSASSRASEHGQQKQKRHDDTFEEVRAENDDVHAPKKDITIERSHPLNKFRTKAVSLADCVTEASSVVTEKLGIFGRTRSKNHEYTGARSVPVSSSSLLANEFRQRSGHDSGFEIQRENINAYSPENDIQNYEKGVSLADCVTEASSVATEKRRSIFGRASSRKGRDSQDYFNVQSVPVASATSSVGEFSRRIRHDGTVDSPNEKGEKDTGGGISHSTNDHENKRASLADCLTENSSAVTGRRSIFGRNRSKNETIQQDDANTVPDQLLSKSSQQGQNESNAVKKREEKFAKNLAAESKSEIPVDTRGDVPEFLCPDDRLEHVSSDLTFSSMPVFAQDMIKSSPSPVTTTPDFGFKQKSMPVSPLSEALEFAKSQAGSLKWKFGEEAACRDGKNKETLESAVDYESGATTFPSAKGPLNCGLNDVMRVIDPEWEDCEEFGKGKRICQQADTGSRVADVVQSLRAHFSCDLLGDVMNTVDSGCENRYQRHQDAERSKEAIQSVLNDSPELIAGETVSALRSLRRQLTCGAADYTVNASPSEQTRRYSMHHASACADNERSSDDDSRLSGEHTPGSVPLITQSSEEGAGVRSGNSNLLKSENKRESTNSASITKRGRKKCTNDDESQMMSSFFSGDTPIINNHAKDASKAMQLNFTQDNPHKKLGATASKRAQPSSKTLRLTRYPISRERESVGNKAEAIAEKRAQVSSLIEETLLEGGEESGELEEDHDKEGEVDEDKDEQEKDEEQSIYTSASKQYRGNKTPVFNGTNKLRDVQLVLSASSTLELPKHKRNTVIRFATVPGDISYQQATDTLLQEHQIELERKTAQKHMKLAQRAVISGQYMDNLDPCFRIFDPALDACDRFCTNSPSEDSDDECSIASASVCEDNKTSIGLRQRAQNYMMEPAVWPCSGRPRRVKAPCRLV